MDISSARYSGDMEINCDYIGMLEDRGCGCFAVCDGSLSGLNGDKVSELVIDSVLSDFKNTSDITRILSPVILKTQMKNFGNLRTRLKTMAKKRLMKLPPLLC